MAALRPSASQVLPIAGVRLGVAAAEISKKDRDDVCVLLLDEGTTVGAVFTQNRFCAAPVQICQAHLHGNAAGVRALLINTGVANAGTGKQGLADAHAACMSLAKTLSCAEQAVLPFSTGVIMEPLPVQRLIAALPVALMDAKEDNWKRAARSIMTTDTVSKMASAELSIDGHLVRVSGMSKGSGMIHPNMATMLGFMATDAYIAPELMADLSKRLADASFNRISVDGDTSTNDSFVLMATGKQSQVRIETLEDLLASPLWQTLVEVAQRLAQAIVRDGEGASKLIQIEVSEGVSEAECLQVARAIAHSPLVKTAFFASDPNLGRILAAVGYAGITDLAQERIRLSLGDVLVVENGARAPSYLEEDGQRVMAAAEIDVYVGLGRGQARAVLWTCDLSYDYVRINADYRS